MDGVGWSDGRRASVALFVCMVLGSALTACGADDADVPGSNDRASPPQEAPTQRVTAPAVIGPSSTAATTTAPAVAPSRPLTGHTIVVDPGHNGANGVHLTEINRTVDAGGFRKACNTTGAAADGTAEAELNWLLALELRDRLEANGAEVVLTRQDNDGWGPCIDERGLTALHHDADLLLSLHADGAAETARGFHVIYPGPVPGYVEEDVASDSESLATAIRDGLVDAGLERATYIADGSGTHQRTDLGTLNLAGVPAIMLEAGNLHHPPNLADLRDPAWRSGVAEAITQAVVLHLDEEEADE